MVTQLGLKSLKMAVIGGLALMGGMVALGGSAQALAVPTCVQPDTCLQFGDFDVYSLPYLNFLQTGATSDPNNGDPYYVPSAPGHIQDMIVLGTGANGQNVTTNIPNVTDDAYPMPSGQAGSPFMSTGTVADPNGDGEFGGDMASTWDARITELGDFLGGGGLQLYFNLNEDGASQDELLGAGQDLLVWAEVTLADDALNNVVSFVLDGTNPDPFLQAQTLVNYTGADSENKDYAHVHGEICVDDTADAGDRALIHLGACGDPDFAAEEAAAENPRTMNQNLGANVAAFMVQSTDLNTAFYSGLYEYIQVDFRLARLSNGYEQLFLGSEPLDTPQIPEPATLALFGVGLAGLGLARRRR